MLYLSFSIAKSILCQDTMKRKISRQQAKNYTKPKKFFRSSLVRSLVLGIVPAILTSVPVEAAENLIIDYEGASISLNIDELETFAREGKVGDSVKIVVNRMKPEQQAEFRKALLMKGEKIDPMKINRFLRTPIGEEILTQAGKLIRLQGSRNGKYAIRSAVYKAATDADGLTIINFLRQFSKDPELNAKNLIQVANKVKDLIKDTKQMTTEMKKLSSQEAAASKKVNFASLPDLRNPGKFGYNRITRTFNDRSRGRRLKVDIYSPKQWRKGKTPVVIASHGLASERKHFQKQAEHLATYGYLVVAPQHPGSDNKQFKDMLSGFSREIFKLNEFIERPLDVTYLLNELEKQNQSNYQGKLNLSEVGVIGHSFGGYTALALAGAEIDFQQLEKDCTREIWQPNLSLLLQCRGLELERKTHNFREPRVKAVIAVNPVNASIFGPNGLSKIEIPVFLGAGTKDPATPALTEQIFSFTWLKGEDNYLALVKGRSHIDRSRLEGSVGNLLKSIGTLEQPEPYLFVSYGNAMVTAFFQSYIAKNPDYRSYLQASYAKYISQQPFNMYLLQSSSSDALSQSLADLRAQR